MRALGAETDKACSADDTIDLKTLLSECPHLDAVWYEVLRIYNAASVVREAVTDITIGGKKIRTGDTIMGPFRQFQTNPEIFGSDAHAFNPGRFLANQNLHRAKGYHPFGGGVTYCPGRFFARSEVYQFVAMTLYRFELEVGPDETVPAVDLKTPSPAAMKPTRDILVRLRPRVVEHKHHIDGTAVVALLDSI
jgi:cytochrome P450